MKEDRRKKERCVTRSKLAHTLTHRVDEYKLVYAHIIQCESIEREYQWSFLCGNIAEEWKRMRRRFPFISDAKYREIPVFYPLNHIRRMKYEYLASKWRRSIDIELCLENVMTSKLLNWIFCWKLCAIRHKFICDLVRCTEIGRKKSIDDGKQKAKKKSTWWWWRKSICDRCAYCSYPCPYSVLTVPYLWC